MPEPPDRLAEALKDRYTIQRELGRGGMATVYLATDRKHERSVALKVLKPELAAVLGTDRFLREIKTTAQLTHPHILPLLDSGEADETLFYVMPFVEGESLRDRLNREKQLPVEDALQISREVADALSYAHSHGVIHRDVKPENILLQSGHAVVADFGIGRAIDQAGGDRLTSTGLALGTPAYMSPEQAAGSKDLDGRSDLYALGCVLYEMLAGHAPFVGASVESLIHQHLTAQPANITGIRPAVPAHVVAALERALAKTPADRFNPVALFAEALGPRASAPVMPGAARSPSIARRPFPWQRIAGLAIAAVVVIAVVVAVGRRLRPGERPSPRARTDIAVLPLQNLSADGPYAYFAGGLHDELLTQLAKVAALKVISRTSVMEYATGTKQLKEIAVELDVGTIVEGSVQVVGDRLRVHVQLIDAATDEHLWAEHYDRTLDDAFAVQSDIAQRIVTAVGAALTGAEATALAAMPTQDAEAYRLYLQGEEYRQRPGYGRQDLESAEQLYERALALDSTFALAYASLSIVHGLLYRLEHDPHPSRVERQRATASAALRFGPSLPQARAATGMVHYMRDDYARALPELTAAAEALPGSAELWGYVGYANRRLGNWNQVLAAFHRATALNPRDATLIWDLGGNTLFYLHRYDEAAAAYRQAFALAPDMRGADRERALTYVLWQGRVDSLRAVLERGDRESDGADGGALSLRARLGLWERAPDTLLAMLGGADQMVSYGGHQEPGLLYRAWAHQLRGDREGAAVAFRGALTQLDSALGRHPEHWGLHASRGLALAGLGREADARKEAEWLTTSQEYRDLYGRGNIFEARAMIFAQLGLAQEAVTELEPVLDGPSRVSAPLIGLDPRYDPIRQDPRFQRLLRKYANPQPVR